MFDILENKKNNLPLTKEEINYFVENYTSGLIPDYQMSALLMAIAINGMNDDELSFLTESMVKSGDQLDLSAITNTIDKHSTGGVGDKTTLIVCPIVACLGCNVAKMSGKGLGFTGGTADKLESLKMNINLSYEQLIDQVNKINIALVSQTDSVAPADKKIYALRDVTATVESIPLIASSIMSKKIASGAKNLVLDVKVGSGAFMKDVQSAKILSNKMIAIGKKLNINLIAILTNMDIPLGNKIGNLSEVSEALEILQNNGPSDLKELSIVIASYMYSIAKKIEINKARRDVIEVLENGKAYKKFLELVEIQGGNINCVDYTPKYQHNIYSLKEGYINQVNTEIIGKICNLLGAGRNELNSKIDYTAGIELHKKTGDYIKTGDLIATFYSSTIDDFSNLEKDYLNSLIINNEKPNIKLIYEIVE